jgi:hypothetical protein
MARWNESGGIIEAVPSIVHDHPLRAPLRYRFTPRRRVKTISDSNAKTALSLPGIFTSHLKWRPG